MTKPPSPRALPVSQPRAAAAAPAGPPPVGAANPLKPIGPTLLKIVERVKL